MKIELQDAIEKFGAEAMPAGNVSSSPNRTGILFDVNFAIQPYEAALGMLKLVMQLIGLDVRMFTATLFTPPDLITRRRNKPFPGSIQPSNHVRRLRSIDNGRK